MVREGFSEEVVVVGFEGRGGVWGLWVKGFYKERGGCWVCFRGGVG